MTKKKRTNGHMLPVGIIGLVSAVGLIVYVPRLHGVSHALLWFAAFHLMGGAVLASSVYVLGGSKLASRLRSKRTERYDFGWESSWTLGPWIAAQVLIGAAIAIQVTAPRWWLVAIALTLLSASFFAGGLIARTASRYECAVLPMVDFGLQPGSVVLDAGCGSGRTSLAIGRAYPKVRIVAVDRFDADYIENGGRTLLEKNLLIAGVAERVEIRQGDLTRLPFEDRHFDAVVSAHAMDHLGAATMQGVREAMRVLKPGGRLLLCNWVPGWPMFAVANVLSFHLRSRKGWLKIAGEAGFDIVDEGMFNGYYFLVLSRPEGGTGLPIDATLLKTLQSHGLPVLPRPS